MEQSTEKKKKKKEKGVLSRISNKISGDSAPDELVLDTLGELKGIVGSMRNVFEEFDTGYSKQLEDERTTWQKIESKLPKALQSSATKSQEHRVTRIKSNKGNLSELEDNLSKLELILSSSNSSVDALSRAYIHTASAGKTDDEAAKDLEVRMDLLQTNLTESMGEIAAQISLIKSALDNMAGQLDDQGVKLEGIDGKINIIDSKLDVAHEMLKKISKQITGNRLIVLAVVVGVVAVLASKMAG